MRIAELDRQLLKIPPEIEKLEAECTTTSDQIVVLTARKDELERIQGEQQVVLQTAVALGVKFEKDLHEVTNNKEYHAVLKEIDAAKKNVHSLEEDISNRKKELTEISGKIEEFCSIEVAARTQYEEALSSHKESQAENETERSLSEKVRVKLASSVPERLMRQFERIAARRNGIGLSLCVSASCRTCNVRVRQNIVNELRKFKQVITCESCKRILFFAEGDE